MYDTGKRIKQLRKAQGMTLEELGNKVGVTKSTIRKWEEGIIENMRRDKIAAVAKALGCSPDYLLGCNSNEDDATKYKVLVDSASHLNGNGYTRLMEYLEFLTEQDKYRKD